MFKTINNSTSKFKPLLVTNRQQRIPSKKIHFVEKLPKSCCYMLILCLHMYALMFRRICHFFILRRITFWTGTTWAYFLYCLVFCDEKSTVIFFSSPVQMGLLGAHDSNQTLWISLDRKLDQLVPLPDTFYIFFKVLVGRRGGRKLHIEDKKQKL